MVCGGWPKVSSAARNSSGVFARATPSRAEISSVGRCPAQRSASVRPGSSSSAASETIGPCGAMRTVRTVSNQNRVRMRVGVEAIASGCRFETS